MACGFFIIFWVAIAALLVWIVFRDRPDARQRILSVFVAQQSRTDPAEEILRGRLARGEIDAEEYERSLRVLKGWDSRNPTTSLGAPPVFTSLCALRGVQADMSIFSKHLANEGAGRGVRINFVTPAGVLAERMECRMPEGAKR
jgi:putative membrane protein